MAESDYCLRLFVELNISKNRSCRDHSLGQSPLVCWPKPGQLNPVTSWLPWALGHWPPAMGQAPSHAREPISTGMQQPCDIFLGLLRLRWNQDTVEIMTPSLGG